MLCGEQNPILLKGTCELPIGHEGQHKHGNYTWEDVPESSGEFEFGTNLILAMNTAFGVKIENDERNRLIANRLFDRTAEENNYGHCPDCSDRSSH